MHAIIDSIIATSIVNAAFAITKMPLKIREMYVSTLIILRKNGSLNKSKNILIKQKIVIATKIDVAMIRLSVR